MKKLYQYPFSCIIQLLLCKIGIACHNPFRDECTPDFECCSPLHKELMDKHGINASNPKLSKIGTIMADAFEKEGVYSLISPEVEHRLVRAVEIAAKELVKMV